MLYRAIQVKKLRPLSQWFHCCHCYEPLSKLSCLMTGVAALHDWSCSPDEASCGFIDALQGKFWSCNCTVESSVFNTHIWNTSPGLTRVAKFQCGKHVCWVTPRCPGRGVINHICKQMTQIVRKGYCVLMKQKQVSVWWQSLRNVIASRLCAFAIRVATVVSPSLNNGGSELVWGYFHIWLICRLFFGKRQGWLVGGGTLDSLS